METTGFPPCGCLGRFPAWASSAASLLPRPQTAPSSASLGPSLCLPLSLSLWPPPPASDAFFRNLPSVPKLQPPSKQASQASPPPTRAFLGSSAALGPGRPPRPHQLLPALSPQWRPQDSCTGRLRPSPQRSEASSTTPNTGAGGADRGCGVRARGTARGRFLCQAPVLFPLPVTGSVHIHSGLERNVCPSREKSGYLSQLCLEFVMKVLDVELVCEALQVAVTFGLGPLQERCIAFIEAHSQEVLRTRGFLELSASALLPLLRSDMLCVDEAELVRAARSWARVGAAVLERPVAEVAAPVVRELRLALLAPAELSALEEQNRREPLIPVEQIVEAWKCHALRRGDPARGAPCRRRRGTLPRAHHRFLELPFK
nr:BTB/POZ domain-containing protein 19 isoform X4 [Oryctolagus cuniculus]